MESHPSFIMHLAGLVALVQEILRLLQLLNPFQISADAICLCLLGRSCRSIVKILVKYHKDPYKPNLKKEFFRTWLVSSQGAPYKYIYIYICIYIYMCISTVLVPMRQPTCITHGTHDPLTDPEMSSSCWYRIFAAFLRARMCFMDCGEACVQKHDISVETF